MLGDEHPDVITYYELRNAHASLIKQLDDAVASHHETTDRLFEMQFELKIKDIVYRIDFVSNELFWCAYRLIQRTTVSRSDLALRRAALNILEHMLHKYQT